MLRSTQHEALETIRQAALDLHTQHIAQVRLEHVARHGPITPAELLQKLAFGDEHAWLRSLGAFIVELDAQLEGDVSSADVAAAQARLDAQRVNSPRSGATRAA
jgi:hypothetical protein